MRSLLARLAALGALAVSLSACGGGNGNSLPFAGEPNAAGGSNGTIQTGSNGQALIRFVQGSPDVVTGSNTTGTVDVCIDALPLGITNDTAAYGKATALASVPAGIAHTIAVYRTQTPGFGSVPGSECATAPGPYFGQAALAVTTFTPVINSRFTVVLAGTAATHTFGLYVFTEPSFVNAPGGNEVVSHNAAPGFSTTTPTKTVGFGTCSTTATPCAAPANLAGATSLAPPKIAAANTATATAAVVSPLAAIPAGFFDGAGVPTGTVIPITSVAAPAPVAGQPYVIDLYAIDAAAGGLGLIAIPEQTLGYGF